MHVNVVCILIQKPTHIDQLLLNQIHNWSQGFKNTMTQAIMIQPDVDKSELVHISDGRFKHDNMSFGGVCATNKQTLFENSRYSVNATWVSLLQGE